MDFCGKFLSIEKIFHAVPRGHPMRTKLDFLDGQATLPPTNIYIFLDNSESRTEFSTIVQNI